MRRHEHEQRRADSAATPRNPEPLPVESTVLGLQRAAGNRAVSSLLARQPSPTRQRASTSTLGLGDEIGVIPLDSANVGQGDRDGTVHEITVTFVGNALVPKLHEMHLKSTPIEDGFFSSIGIKLTLKGIVISAMQVTEDRENGGETVSMTLDCRSIQHEKAP